MRSGYNNLRTQSLFTPYLTLYTGILYSKFDGIYERIFVIFKNMESKQIFNGQFVSLLIWTDIKESESNKAWII